MANCIFYFVMMIAVAALSTGCGLSSDPQRMIAKAQEYRAKNDYKAAIIEFKNILQKSPGNAEARYLLGVTYYDNHDYRLAEQELHRALDLSYERSKVMPMLGKSMLMLGDFQKVLDQVPVESHTSNEVQADILTLRARALIGLGRGSQAREVLDSALAKQPEFADALFEQARLAAGEQRRDDAASLTDRAIVSMPKHINAWLMKGDLARGRDDQAGALTAYQKVIEFDPANIEARVNIISLHIANSRFAEARKMIADIRKISPANPMAFHMQALADFRGRDYKAANDAIQQVLKMAPNYMPSALLAGAILTELGSYEQAQQQIGRVLELAPGNLYARKLLVTSLARSGQMQRAIDILQPGLKQAPEDSQLMTLAGELYLQNGEFGKAVAFFDMVTTREPKDAGARARLGISRMASGDTYRSLADLELAAELDSSNYRTDMLLIASHLRRGSYDQALKVVESLEKKQPNNPVTFNLKGGIYSGKKDILNARKNFERALELQPTFLAAAINLAQLDLLEKNPKSARSRIESILDKDKGNVPALLALSELGPALDATERERIDWLERARKANPQSVQPQVNLVGLYSQMGDTKKALEVAQQAHTTNPESLQLLDLLGATQLNAGQKEQALASFRKLVQLQPKSPVALYRFASAQAHTADYAAAVETQKKALILAPDFVDAQIALVGLEIRAGRYAEALDIARQAQKQNMKSPFGFALEGEVLMAEKKYAQAIKVYETAHGMAKNSASLISLVTAYVSAGRTDVGDARVAQWLREVPDDAVVRLYAADGALKRGAFKEAIAHYEWMQQRQPDNVLLLNNLAWAYYEVKDPRALGTAEHAFKLKPNNVKITDTLGWILVEQGNTMRGIELLEKAAKAAPALPVTHYHLAKGWLKVGDKAKALQELERALAINAKFPYQTEAQKLVKQLSN